MIININKAYNLEKLTQELSIIPEFINAYTLGNDLVINLSNESTEITNSINGILNSHNGNIYPIKLTGRFDLNELMVIDYDILGLHKNRIITVGELREINYYRNYDQVTYTDLVIRETRRYIRNPATGLLIYRLLNVYWYNTNDEVAFFIENRIKHYSFQESIEEMQTRRRNIIAEAKKYLLYLLIQDSVIEFGEQTGKMIGFQKSLEFLASVKIQSDYYADGIGQPLEDAINNSTFTYMTQQIKDALLSILVYDYTVTD